MLLFKLYYLFRDKHIETKPYICAECGAIFESMDVLNVHVQSHDSEVRPCGTCFKTFTNSWQLDRHIEQTHGGESDNEEIGREAAKAVVRYSVNQK